MKAPDPDRGIVFQDYALLYWMAVLDNILFALDCNAQDRNKEERRDEALRCLEMVRLSDHANRRPAELSGGMKQRVGLARTLALDPKVILLDEPFGALDALTRSVLQDELLGILEEPTKTVLLVTHDVDVRFERPRDREEVLASPEYLELHRELMGILTQELAV